MTAQIDDIKERYFSLVNKVRQGVQMPCEPDAGITGGESHVLHMLYTLSRHPEGEPVRPKELALLMCVTPSALSQVVKSLEGKGLVERSRSASDNRAVSLSLTPEGERLAERIDVVWCKAVSDCVEYVGRDDFLTMMIAMEKMIDFQATYHCSFDAPIEQA